MTNFFILIPLPVVPSNSKNDEMRKRTDKRTIWKIILCVAFLLLLCVGYVLYVLTPPTHGYKNVEKLGPVDCHINGISEQGGYVFYLKSELSSETYTTIVSKKRAKELASICLDDPTSDNVYRLDVYSTGTDNVYVSTYDGLSREEAWKDYKTALRDNSLKAHDEDFVMAIICSVILAVSLIFVIRWLVRTIRDEKTQKAIASTQNRELAESMPEEDPKKEELADEALLESLDTNNNSWHK